MGIRFKKITFLLLNLLLFIIIYHCFNRDYLDFDFSYDNIKNEIINSHILNKNIFVNLKLDDTFCSYDSEKNICYFYDDFKDEKFFRTKVYSYDSIDYVTMSGYNIVNQLYNRDSNYILLYNDKYYFELKVEFVNIPIVNINYMIEAREYDDLFKSNFLFKVYDDLRMDKSVSFQLYDNVSRSTIRNIGSMHVRGATSSAYGKKSFRLELNSKYSLLGMRQDEDWILDALYTDKSKIRNKLSSDIWGLIDNNQKIVNDVNTRFVELFVDNHYQGLYVLKEPVDHKTVSIDGNGLLIKVVNKLFYDYNSILNYESDSIGSYELKYPKGEYSYWKFFFARMYSNDSYSDLDIYDENNFLNLKVFLLLIGGKDNDFKNQYLSMNNKNSKILITPWDMDLTWGLNWNDDNDLHSDFSMESIYDNEWISNNVIGNMDFQTLSLLRKRYWELRKNVITMDTINGYLDSYKKLLVDSGAAKRDSDRWYKYDVDFEIEQIREWARRRIEFLDEYFK